MNETDKSHIKNAERKQTAVDFLRLAAEGHIETAYEKYVDANITTCSSPLVFQHYKRQ